MQTRDGSSFSTVSFIGGSNAIVITNPDGDGPDGISANAYVFSTCDTDGDGLPDYCDLDSDNDGIADVIEAGGTDANGDGIIDGFTDTDSDGFADGLDPLRGGTALADGDQDGDGLENRIDLDADNDGIADIIEAGGTDANNDGVGDTSTDTDADGWFNTFDSDDGGTVLPTTNTDGDALANYLDLDSDSDGITDNVEGQTTVAFLAPLGTDTDGDGWDNRYDSDDGGTAITLSNNESVGNPDYTDDDSDGDGLPDWIEGFDDDEDQDALDDLLLRATNFETAAGNPLFYLTSDDNNGTSDGDGIPDWLEDDDTDNIPNFLDPDNAAYHDTDGDGLIDLYDTDNFGVASILPDGDSDGEYDFRDTDNQISLPIVLVDFTAVKNGNHVQLDWSTSSEINNDYFTIERSVDGIYFEAIIQEKGAGNSNVLNRYQRFDNQPYLGYNYYRLSQTDFDGKTESFEIRSVFFESGKPLISLYPNPTDGNNLFLDFAKPELGNCRIIILTQEGKIVKTIQLNIDQEMDNYRLDLAKEINLASGAYYIKVVTNSDVKTLPFIIR